MVRWCISMGRHTSVGPRRKHSSDYHTTPSHSTTPEKEFLHTSAFELSLFLPKVRYVLLARARLRRQEAERGDRRPVGKGVHSGPLEPGAARL